MLVMLRANFFHKQVKANIIIIPCCLLLVISVFVVVNSVHRTTNYIPKITTLIMLI